MKIRSGFVSNSSSSSFCILGISEADGWYQEKIGSSGDDLREDLEAWVSEHSTMSLAVEGSSWNYIDYAIGIPPNRLDKELTIGENEKRLSEELQKIFNLEEPPKVYWCEAAWRDD